MTRYEMAQIVAKAMAKGANVDKLAAEFADELDALGVRVAALEKKSDNVKITGNIRIHYTSGKIGDDKGSDSQFRTRLTFTGKVNDNWNYVGMLENRQVFHTTSFDGMDFVGEDNHTQWQRAYLDGRLGGLKVQAGRFQHDLGHSESDLYSGRMDGVRIAYGDKVRLGAYYGKPSNYHWSQEYTLNHDKGYKKAYGVNIEGDLGKNVTLWAGWDKFVDNKESAKKHGDDRDVWNVGGEYRMKDVKLAATYAKSGDNTAIKDKGFYVDLSYKGAKASKPGSWGLFAKYYNWGDGLTMQAHGWDNSWCAGNGGWVGFKVGANYAVAKNMVATISYWDLKDKVARDDGNKLKSKTLWTSMVVTF
jgi:predicted porin